jgi:hypothetical protein
LNATCLILHPTGRRKGQFERVGIIEMDFESHKIPKLDAIKNGDWFEFEKFVGGGEYIIMVV